MKKGRKSVYQERQGIFLNCPIPYYNIARFLKIPDMDIYIRGVTEFAKERASELSENQLDLVLQDGRIRMKQLQDDLALIERLAYDAKILDQKRRQKQETRIWDGQEVIVGVAE